MPRYALPAWTAAAAILLAAPLSASATQQAAGPLCGASFAPESAGESYQQAFERVDGYYGLESVRVFYPGLPDPWPGKLDAGKRTLTVSFKATPQEITGGEHDQRLREWFADAPRDRDIYWSYFHEPEDNISDGEFTAGQYRAAWQHLSGLAAEAGNPRLRATLILMEWSANPGSGRDWRDYYPGARHVDVLGWDAYNQITGETTKYRPADEIFGSAVSASEDAGKPFAIAETGSALATGDSGADRAAWLREVGDYLTERGALWVQYFDLDYTEHGHSDYRLRDEAGKRAWREFCAG